MEVEEGIVSPLWGHLLEMVTMLIIEPCHLWCRYTLVYDQAVATFLSQLIKRQVLIIIFKLCTHMLE